VRAPRHRGTRAATLGIVALAAVIAAGCDEGGGSPAGSGSPAAESDPLTALRAFEEAQRKAADFARIPASDKAMGSDPYALRAVPGRRAFASVLRGADALVGLDGSLREVIRLPAPRSPSGLAVSAAGDFLNLNSYLYVTGELDPKVARYVWQGDALKSAGEIELAGVKALRDVAAGPEGVLYLVEEHGGRLITLLPQAPGKAAEGLSFDSSASGSAAPKTSFERVDAEACAGALRVVRAGEFVIVDCLLDHTLLIRRVNDRGLPLREGEVRIRHDGPIFGFEAAPRGGAAVVIAAGGVEDRPLDRAEGSFGFIDSFVFLYEVSPGAAAPVKKLAEVNVSELGVITPKALRLDLSPEEARVRVAGYGGGKLATLVWKGNQGGAPETSAVDVPPGTTSIAAGPEDGSLSLANPLLDAWITVDKAGTTTVARADGGSAADPAIKLGEALFFTSLMAPWNKSEGRLSRFTCETCHFEGYVDGRTHHTGRGDVRATTKPLLGLFNNRPHFSRALDPDLSAVAHNEFRVAGAKSGRDPWFSIDSGDYPWLASMGAAAAGGEALGPDALRRSLMAFLMAFSHRPNPASAGRASFSPLERRGADVFRARCEGCHSARLAADDPASSVPFGGWEALIFAREGPIVWARSDYKQTGVTPYVHERGARVPSLRRLYKKRPYFTNGSAKTLDDVLSRARYKGDDPQFYHAGAPEGAGLTELTALTAEEREALLSFLDLL